MTWATLRLGDAVAKGHAVVQTGPFGSQLHQHDYVDDGVPVVMPKDIIDGDIDLSGVARVGDAKAQEMARHSLTAGDIVFPRRGDIRKCALVTPQTEGSLCGTGCLKIQVDKLIFEPRFLYHVMSSDEVGSWLEGRAVGTTMLNLSAGILADLKIPAPPLQVQASIVATVSAYDDLIDNNRRRIKLLEDSVRLLFDEWFVRLRFPGHAPSSSTGGMPNGWSKIALDKILLLQRGFDLPSQDREAGDVPIYGSTGIVGFHNKAKVKGPGLVTGRSGSLGEVHFVAQDFWPLNTALWVKEFKRATPLFALHLLRNMNLEQYNGGVSVPTLDRKVVHKAEVLLPAASIMTRFESVAFDVYRQINTLTEMNLKLRTARDLLLPRLMSGELVI